MADTEKEAFRQIGVDLINEYRVRGGFKPIDWLAINTPEVSAFIRSIQLHEKIKKELQGVKQELADFRQEVSDIVHHYVYACGGPDDWEKLKALIIPKPEPDPLFDVLWDLGMAKDRSGIELMANRINETLDARGLEIREKNDG